MGILTFILGVSGTGKTSSLRNFESDEIAVINVQGKVLPFKGSAGIKTVNTDDSAEIVKEIKKLSKDYKRIVVDDFQYVMANEFMRRVSERGYDKFAEIGRHAWDIPNVVRELPNDVIVYIMCHTDTDADGKEKLKTIGRMLDEKICLEGMSAIVLKTNVCDGQYTFLTQNNGKDTVKSPAGMFPSYAIDNDLKYVDEKIRNYFEIGDFLSDEEIAEIDEMAKKDDVPFDGGDKKKRRRKKSDEEESQEEEKPKRSRRKKSEDTVEERDKEIEEVKKRNSEKVAEAGLDDSEGDEVPYENVEEPELEEVPRRKRRSKADDVEDESQAQEEEEKPRRRRRRSGN